MARVLLVHPPWYALQNVYSLTAPVGLAYIGAVLKQEGHEVLIFHGEPPDFEPAQDGSIAVDIQTYKRRLDLRDPIWWRFSQLLRNFNPDMVGISTWTSAYQSAMNIATICKEYDPDLPVIAGGIHATLLPDEMLHEDGIDVLVRSEGERTTVELISCLGTRRALDDVAGVSLRKGTAIQHNPPRPYIEDLDSLPFPAYDLIYEADKYPADAFGGVITSRGCPYQCTFCASSKLWGRNVRFRSPENIVAEIERSYKDFGTRYFRFNDDSFTIDKVRVMELCDLLVEKNLDIHWMCDTRVDVVDKQMLAAMEQARCWRVNVGVESGDPRIRHSTKKGISVGQIREAVTMIREVGGIQIGTYFMMGFPGETTGQVRESIKLMEELKPDDAIWSLLTPYPGTEIYDHALEHGLIPKDLDWSFFFHQSPQMKLAQTITASEWSELLDEVGRKRQKLTRQAELARHHAESAESNEPELTAQVHALEPEPGTRAQNSPVAGDRNLPRSILFVTNFTGIVAGADRVLLNILKELPASIRVYLVGNKDTERLLAYLPREEHISVFDVEYHTYPYTVAEWQPGSPKGRALERYLDHFLEQNFRALQELTQLLQGTNIDLVHSNTSTVVLGALYAKCYGIKHVWHAHEVIAADGEAQLFWTWLMNELSDAIIVPSQCGAAGYGPKCVLIPGGFNVADFLGAYSQLPRIDAANKLNIRDEEAVIISLGTISKTKGQVELVQAISQILSGSGPSVGRQIRAVVAGYCPDGTHARYLKRLIADCQLEDIVTVTGLLAYGEAMALLKRADIVVQPSTLPECYPTAVIEAMLAGKPVIASRIGGMLEMIDDGRTGLLCKPADPEDLACKILGLVQSPAVAARLGENAARCAVEKFDIRRTMEALTQLYERLMSSPPKPMNGKDCWQAILMKRILVRDAIIQARDEELASVKHVLQARDEELASVKYVLQAREEELEAYRNSLPGRASLALRGLLRRVKRANA